MSLSDAMGRVRGDSEADAAACGVTPDSQPGVKNGEPGALAADAERSQRLTAVAASEADY
jgi:hypothetical protein